MLIEATARWSSPSNDSEVLVHPRAQLLVTRRPRLDGGDVFLPLPVRARCSSPPVLDDGLGCLSLLDPVVDCLVPLLHGGEQPAMMARLVGETCSSSSPSRTSV
jgi:hypothetical protein